MTNLTSVRLLLALGALAASAGAQAPATTPARTPFLIEPGMTRDQVIASLGQPQGSRTVGTRTFLFYSNGRARRTGTQDVVFLENGAVVDAIFRAPQRRYSGTSSSQPGVRPAPTNIVITAGGSPPPGTASVPSGGSSTVLPSISAPGRAPAPTRSTSLENVSRPVNPSARDTAAVRMNPPAPATKRP